MPRMPAIPTDLITIAEAAKILKLDPSQVRRHVLAKRLRSVKVHDRLTLVSRAEVETFVPPKPGPKPAE